jgi:hypothetical protein
MTDTAIAARAVGAYPISIATSLAIESACGEHPDIPVNRAPILDYPELYVNVRTLFRNFIGALDKETAASVLSPQIATALVEEMEQISSIIHDHTNGRTRVVYYVSNYKISTSSHKLGILRTDNTAKQKEYTAIQTQTLDILLRWNKDAVQKIAVFDLKLKPDGLPRAMIITHYAFDLLSYPAFSRLTLLESHTGAVKERAQFYTKYENGRELSMIPFREDFIQVFGDKETFRSQDIKMRKALIEIATKYRWSAVTTKEKIIYGINQMQNPYYKEILREILV